MEKGSLQEMNSVVIKARDGLPLVSYLTPPAGVQTKESDGIAVPTEAVPMVLLVHGDPGAATPTGTTRCISGLPIAGAVLQ